MLILYGLKDGISLQYVNIFHLIVHIVLLKEKPE